MSYWRMLADMICVMCVPWTNRTTQLWPGEYEELWFGGQGMNRGVRPKSGGPDCGNLCGNLSGPDVTQNE